MEAIVEMVACLFGPATELGKCIVVPIKDQFSYLCCFNRHIKSLMDEAKELEDARAELQMQVEEAEWKAEGIVPRVQNWLTIANEIQDSKSAIENEIPKVESGCLNIISRYSLSKKAENTTNAMKKHRTRNNFNIISRGARPTATDLIPLEQKYELESRKHIEKEIMEALGDNKVDIIGMWGMGGVGKTTIAERIRNRVIEEHIFDEAVMVAIGKEAVGKELDKLVLHEISHQLGLPEVKAVSSGACQLRNRLIQRKRKILIVLDDIWEDFQLEKLGIASQDGVERHHKVLLTSRNKGVLERMVAQKPRNEGVLERMGAQKLWEIETLDEREARDLFIEKSGICLNDFNLLPIAEDIVKECSGLPLALTIVGCGLKSKRDKEIWEGFLQQLKNANRKDVPLIIEKVYEPLKASYELLRNENAQSLFLLCSLFPEDSDISVKDLTLYCMGLPNFQEIGNLEEARITVRMACDLLKEHFLLLDGLGEHHCVKDGHVRMHDVVRDVAIFIASTEGLAYVNPHSRRHNSYSECKWISFFPEKGSQLLPNILQLNVPSLHMLMMDYPLWKKLEIEDFSFLEGMKGLRVLFFKSISFKSVPQTMQFLKNLCTLHIESCPLETFFVVGELLSLEILCFRHCGSIMELPTGIGRLKRLKLLEFSDCTELKVVPPGVLSNLIELEELTMVESFNRWELAEAKEKEIMNVNASLQELQSLPHLTCLNIEIEDCTLAAKEMPFLSKIVKYHIKLGTSCFMINERPFEKKMHLNLPRGITIGNWIRTFATTTEELCLSGDGSNILDLLQVPDVKSLHLQKCSTVGSLAIAMDSLLRLQDLRIASCSMMKQVFLNKGDGKKSHFTLPQLKTLELSDLESLTTFCQEVGSIEFPMLTGIKICHCPRITNLASSIENNQNSASTHLFHIQQESNSFKNLERLDLERLPALKHLWNNPNQNVSLSNLSSITVWKCDRLCSLAIAMDSLSQLQDLQIASCSMMEQVFSSKRDGKKIRITFPQLKRLELYNLENLTTFCQEVGSIEFPMLTEIEISNCPRITSLVSSIENNQNSASTHLFCSQEESNSFKNVERLFLYSLPALKHLWNNPNQIVSFSNLSSITIRNCGLGSLAIAMDSLLQLRHLWIDSCSMMEQVFSSKRDGKKSRITFPQLKSLKLSNLENLTTFCQEVGSIEFPTLSRIGIHNCPRITSLVSSIENNQNSASTHLFCSQEVSFDIFPMLKSLKLSGLHNLCYSPIPVGSNFFKNIEEIEIAELPKLKHLWKSSQQNEEKEKHGEITTHITFQQLEKLVLRNLENFTIFSEGIESIEFPALTRIKIIDCPKLTSLVSSSMGNHQNSPNNQDDDSIHLFCKVTIGSLEKLKIGGYNNISKIWCHQIPDSFFTRLTKLKIVECNNIRSLFSFAVARNLVNLGRLAIWRCKEMMKVIEDDEEMNGQTSCPLLLFPRLEDLTLDSLPKLGSFCEWRCDIELPKLSDVCINGCPMMKVFTMGSLISTPNAGCIDIENQDGSVGDLNELVKLHCYTSRGIGL